MSILQGNNENFFSLSIARLGIILHCENPSLVDSLRHRYREFPLHHQPHFTIEIVLTGQERTSTLMDTGIKLEREGIFFTASGYLGHIFLESGVGQLTLSSKYPVEDIDYFIRVVYSLLAFRAGGVMLHAAGIIRDGLAHLFIGPSGAGKTTIARLSSQFTILNDDLVILLPEEDGWRVYGTPFWNLTQVKPSAKSAPLAGLYRLEQASYVHLEPLSSSKAVAELVANTPVLSQDPTRNTILLERLNRITQSTPVKVLYFQPDASFWEIIMNQSA